MPQIEILDPQKHSDLRILEGYSAALGDATLLAPVIASELQSLAVEYPIVFAKNPNTGQFGMFALLGLEEGQNLFLCPDRSWSAHYVPLHFRRQPFIAAGSAKARDRTVAIDLSNRRVSRTDGYRVFDEAGQLTHRAQLATNALSQILAGEALTKKMVEEIAGHDLLAPGRIDAPGSSEGASLDGFYVLDSTKVQSLGQEELAALNASGSLLGIHLIIASMANIPKLLSSRLP